MASLMESRAQLGVAVAVVALLMVGGALRVGECPERGRQTHGVD